MLLKVLNILMSKISAKHKKNITYLGKVIYVDKNDFTYFSEEYNEEGRHNIYHRKLNFEEELFVYNLESIIDEKIPMMERIIDKTYAEENLITIMR